MVITLNPLLKVSAGQWNTLVNFASAPPIMLDQHVIGDRSFVNGELSHPYGRGINFQLEVPSLDEVARRCAQQGLSLFLPIEERWYRQGTKEVGQRQLIVAYPDGYLVRCMQSLGSRSAAA